MDRSAAAAELRARFMNELGRMKGLKKDPQSIADELARWVALIDHWKTRPFVFAASPPAKELADLAKKAIPAAEKAINLLRAIHEFAQIEAAEWDEHGRMVDGASFHKNGHRMCESLNFIQRELELIEVAQKRFENRARTGVNHPANPGPRVAREIALRLRAAGVRYEDRAGRKAHDAGARWVWSLLDLDSNPEGAMREACVRRTSPPSQGDIWDGVPFRYKEEQARTLEGVWMRVTHKEPSTNTD